MAHVDSDTPPAESVVPESPSTTTPTTKKKTPLIVNIIAGLAIIGLCGFIFSYGRVLYQEWSILQKEEARTRNSVAVGYVGITPQPSFARPPKEWFRKEADALYVWSRWHDGKHEWFKFDPSEIDTATLRGPEGRDSARGIDIPIIEVRGGPRFDRVPEEANVAGLEYKGSHFAYPYTLLERVRVVNQEIDGTPLVITMRPWTEAKEAVNAYEASANGKRFSFGNSGYYSAKQTPNRPLIYDRGTLSLWIEDADGLAAVAGPSKGTTLKRVSQLPTSSWASWRNSHPKSGLVVGADRTQAPPEL